MTLNRNKLSLILLAVLVGCVKTIRNESVVRDAVWEGDVFVDGVITIETGAVLRIKPGTSVNFLWRDTNNDGIGESGIYVSGTLLAKGEKDRPIVFSSDSKTSKAQWCVPDGTHQWDGIFFTASEGSPNVLSYCRFENAYRAVHSHFSKLEMEGTIVSNNSRGFQFQESDVKIRNCVFNDNYSALRFRDSNVEIAGTEICGNYSAVHILRSKVVLVGSTINNNCLEGIRIKESNGEISNSSITNNRFGILLSDGEIIVNSSFIGKNELDGISSNGSKLKVSRSRISNNGLDGISLNNSKTVLSYNNIAGNRKFNLDNKGSLKIEAANNFWGCSNESEIEKTIEDGNDDSVSGIVVFSPFLKGVDK